MTEATEVKRPRAPAVDVSQLKIEDDVPLVKPKTAERGSAWLPLIQQMKPGQSVFVEGRSAQSLAYVRSLGKEHGVNLTVRTVDGGARIYCVADEAEAVASKAAEDGNDGL